MNARYRLLDWNQGQLELVSVRVFKTGLEAKAYRDVEFPTAQIWAFVGSDGYLVFEGNEDRLMS